MSPPPSPSPGASPHSRGAPQRLRSTRHPLTGPTHRRPVQISLGTADFERPQRARAWVKSMISSPSPPRMSSSSASPMRATVTSCAPWVQWPSSCSRRPSSQRPTARHGHAPPSRPTSRSSAALRQPTTACSDAAIEAVPGIATLSMDEMQCCLVTISAICPPPSPAT